MPSDWANLPHNLLDSIVERFSSSSDYLRFSLVCTSWFGVAKHNHARFAKKLLSHPEPPMLLFYHYKEDAWNFYNVLDNKVLGVQSKMPKRRFCGCSKGWLIHVEQDFTITLTKPIFYKSNNRGKREDLVVRLPELNPPDPEERIGRIDCWVDKCEHFVLKATISADPILDVDEYIVVLTHMDLCQVAFIKPSKDTTWTYLSDPVRIIRDVLQYGEDHFYAIQKLGNLFSVNISSKSNSEAKSLACGRSNVNCMTKYLLDNGKQLLMVDRDYYFTDLDEPETRFTTDFNVYEFCFDKCKWIKESLDENVALFVGENSTISVEATNFPGCKRNCIYFNHDEDRITRSCLRDFGVFDMKTKTDGSYFPPYLEEYVM